MCFKAILPLVFILSAFWTASANSQAAKSSGESHFRTGIEAYQKGDADEARAAFAQALQVSSENPNALYNLALIEQDLGRTGMAIALWRKALALNPGYQPARQALNWATDRLERKEIPHDTEIWETFRTSALVQFSLESFLLVTVLLLFLSGWLLLGYFGKRRQARLDEKPTPKPSFSVLLFSTLFVLFAGLSLSKTFDQQSLRATVIPKKIEVRSTPDPEGTVLFDLHEGLEVIVRDSMGEWRQVTYPGGPTGWVPKTAVFSTQDKVL